MKAPVIAGQPNAEVVAVQSVPGSPPWVLGAPYVPGNIILFNNGMTYVCIQGHTANAGNQPSNPSFWRPIFVAPFTQSHNANAQVTCRGNPGPQDRNLIGPRLARLLGRHGWLVFVFG